MAYHLAGTISVASEDIDAVRAALPEHIRLTKDEAGCRSFEVTEMTNGVFSVIESFDDEGAFLAHQQRVRGTKWAQLSANAIRDYRTWSDEK